MNKYINEIKILQDKKRSGKKRNWRGKKYVNVYLGDSHKRLGNMAKASRVLSCAAYLDFKRSLNDEAIKFHRAYFCKDKLCPVCAMRRSEKLYGQVSRIIDYVEEHEDYRYLFITLTVRNVEGENLKPALDEIHKGFNLLTKRKEFKAMSEGWIRGTEVTTNFKEKTFHHHIHLVVGVKNEYFDEYVGYMSHEKLLGLWKSCLGLDYDPWVYIKKIRGENEKYSYKKRNTITYKKVIAEITKYTAKTSDYIVMYKDRVRFRLDTGIELRDKNHAKELTDWAVSNLDAGLKGRRLVAFGGKFKEVHKLLNLDDPCDGDLENIDGDNKEDIGEYEILRYRWTYTIADYLLADIFTPEQYYGIGEYNTG